jgi:hypothetical protein
MEPGGFHVLQGFLCQSRPVFRRFFRYAQVLHRLGLWVKRIQKPFVFSRYGHCPASCKKAFSTSPRLIR